MRDAFSKETKSRSVKYELLPDKKGVVVKINNIFLGRVSPTLDRSNDRSVEGDGHQVDSGRCLCLAPKPATSALLSGRDDRALSHIFESVERTAEHNNNYETTFESTAQKSLSSRSFCRP